MKWPATSLLISSLLQITGAFAVFEDAIPGGFDNPDGKDTPPYAQGAGIAVYWIKVLAVAGCFGALGTWLQLS